MRNPPTPSRGAGPALCSSGVIVAHLDGELRHEHRRQRVPDRVRCDLLVRHHEPIAFGFLNLDVFGYILMAAGVIGLAATICLRQRKRVRVLKNGKTVEETTTDV